MVKKIKQKIGPAPLAMIAAGLFFSGMAVCVKAAGERIPIFQITFFRAAVSAVIIFAAMLTKKISFRGENQAWLIIRSIVGFIAMALNFFALAHIPLGDAAVLHQTSPFFVMLFGWLLLKESFYRSLLGLTLLCFFGIIIVLRPTGYLFNLGGGAALLSAVFAAGAYVSIRHLHKTDNFWTMAFYFMAAAAILSLPPMILTWTAPTAWEWVLLMGMGLTGTLGQLLMTYAYKHDEASWVAPFAYAGVLFSFLWGVIFFDEIPGAYTMLGASLIVTGGIGIVKLKNTIRVPIPPALHEPIE